MKPVLDLRELNKLIKHVKFCVITLSVILPALSKNDWFTAVDFADFAYFHVAILPSYRKYLCLMVGDCHFQYIVLLSGLPSALWVFIKCMAAVMAYLRRKRIHIFPLS